MPILLLTTRRRPCRLPLAAALVLAPLSASFAQQQFYDALARTCTGAALAMLQSRSCQTCHTSSPGRESSSTATTATAAAYRNSGFSAAVACATLAPAEGANRAPSLTLSPPGSRRAARVGDTVTITARGRDPDRDPVTLSVANLPADATFDPIAGIFRWTPTAPATANLLFRATDRPANGAEPKSKSQAVTLAVARNQPPVLDTLRSPVTVKAGRTVRLSLAAADPDAKDKLKFSFGLDEAGASTQPPGATLQTRPKSPGSRKFNARFQWKAEAALAGTTVTVRFLATDNAPEPLQDEQAVEFRVVP
jgi:hypothetical protein